MLEVGARVRIKDAETLKQEYNVKEYDDIEEGDTFVYDMWLRCQEEATIVKIINSEEPYTSYKLQFDGDISASYYSWNEWMFEPTTNKEEYDPINIEDIW